MKKVVMFFSALVLLSGSIAFAEPAKVLLSASQGEVIIERDKKPINLKVNERLQKGDLVKTGETGSVDIAWPGKWGYRLLGSSECVLASADKKDGHIEMIEGNIIVNIEDLPIDADFKVSTPTAITAVRGTQFWGQVRPLGENQGVTFAVREGQVEITVISTGEIYLVAQGQALDILKEAEEFSIRDALPEEMAAMAQADTINLEDSEKA